MKLKRKQLDELLKDLRIDTGDIILFNRQCSSMSPYGAAICACAKFFGDTQWDHNGVVIKDLTTNELYLLEATLSGVKMRPLVERIMKSNSFEVAARKLQVHRSESFKQKAIEFVNLALNCPYEDRVGPMFNAGVKVPTRMERESLFHELIDIKKELSRLDSDLEHRSNMTEFERKTLTNERKKVYICYRKVVDKLNQTERSAFENESSRPLEEGKVFCSELVAGFYQYLGILLPYPTSKSYLPKHFSTGYDEYLKLQNSCNLLPEVSLRKDLEENYQKYRDLVKDELERCPNSEETNLIVNCLRRHALFHTLNECDLVRIAHKFRRKVLEGDEVLFYQGMEGDFFYVVEQGECDVLIDYDHLIKMNVPLWEGYEMYESSMENPKMVMEGDISIRRHKTVSLPEFQSSVQILGKDPYVLVATNGPGNAFGDSALIYGTPRRATVRGNSKDTKRKIILWRLDKTHFQEAVAEHTGSQASLEERHFLMRVISGHPLFSELDDRAKALAVRKSFSLGVKKGSLIINQGDPGDYFYIIESGKCEISRKKPSHDSELVDKVVGPGASFGEAALLYNSRRGASVKALEDTKIWCMDRAAFLTITRSGSTALLKLFKKVSNVLRDEEPFMSRKDLHRMCECFVLSGSDSDKLKQDRLIKLVEQLLFHDKSGLINFSQFAHFHIALGASNLDLLTSEAIFRILKDLSIKIRSLDTHDRDEFENCGINVRYLHKAISQWASDNHVMLNALMEEQASLDYYRRCLGHISEEHSLDKNLTYTDLCHLIANCRKTLTLDKNSQIGTLFEAFISAVSSDLSLLREVWNATRLQHDTEIEDNNTISLTSQRAELTFDSNAQSGWISAIHHRDNNYDFLHPSRTPMFKTENGEQHTDDLMLKKSVSLVAAIGSGIASKAICAPFERLKILMQVSPAINRSGIPVKVNPYSSFSKGILNMIRISGFRGMFSGYLCHCFWLIPSLPAKFVLCDAYREILDPCGDYLKGNPLAPEIKNLLAGGLAGLTVHSLLYPIDVVRGRLSVQQYGSNNRTYNGIRACFAQMYRLEGPGAFYRGFIPSSIGIFSYIGFNYAIYEFLRPMMILYDTKSSQLGHPSFPGQVLCSATAALASQFLSYPFDLMRRRLQVAGSWNTTAVWPHQLSAAMNESHRLQITGLYRGFFANSLKALPSAVISLWGYEKIKEYCLKG